MTTTDRIRTPLRAWWERASAEPPNIRGHERAVCLKVPLRGTAIWQLSFDLFRGMAGRAPLFGGFIAFGTFGLPNRFPPIAASANGRTTATGGPLQLGGLE